MSNNWFNFLTQNGASFNSNREVSFSSVAQNAADSLFDADLFITDLSWLGTIAVSGADCKTFLQGQLTNDINSISPASSQLSGLCSPKGRLKALFSIFANTDKLYLQLPYPLLEETQKRLKMFVMMSKVELSDVSDSLIKIGIYGNTAEQHLQKYGFSIPEEVGMVSQYKGMQLIRLAGDKARFQCAGANDVIEQLWQSLQTEARLLNTAHWKLLDIYAGLPNIYNSSKEVFIPQMLNLQALDGINFKKGCYTGQEVVARMQYLGKLKRKMYRVHCDTDKLPLPGDQLYSAKVKSGQGAGNIVDAQYSPEGGIDCLAVITNDALDNNDIFLDEALQLKLTLQKLPYSIEAQE